MRTEQDIKTQEFDLLVEAMAHEVGQKKVPYLMLRPDEAPESFGVVAHRYMSISAVRTPSGAVWVVSPTSHFLAPMFDWAKEEAERKRVSEDPEYRPA